MARPTKPTHLKLVEGNRGKRSQNNFEPDAEYLYDLTPPAHLSAEEQVKWNDLAPKLRASKLLTVLEVTALCLLCETLVMLDIIKVELGTDYVSHNSKGTSLNQLMVARSMAFKQAMLLMQQFGMTPAARARVVVNSQGDLFGNEKTGTDYLS